MLPGTISEMSSQGGRVEVGVDFPGVASLPFEQDSRPRGNASPPAALVSVFYSQTKLLIRCGSVSLHEKSLREEV